MPKAAKVVNAVHGIHAKYSVNITPRGMSTRRSARHLEIIPLKA
jgi:hypothetical protein